VKSITCSTTSAVTSGALPCAKWKGSAMPAVDITETDGGFEVTAELPGMDEKNIEVKLANHTSECSNAG
jgi:HSP20 family molecular chaperone IbpA